VDSLPTKHENYFSGLGREFSRVYEVAKAARSKNLDPSAEPESRVAADLAERVEKSVGPRGWLQE